MSTYENVRFVLLEEFVKAQTRNPHFSMRAYAAKIGVGQSVISEVLSGKRPLTLKSAKRILQGLDKDQDEISTLLEASESAKLPLFRSLDMDTFHVISDWHHYAILSLAETKDFQSSNTWIANRLGIKERAAEDAVAKLVRLELLEKDRKTGHLRSTGHQFEATSAVNSPALKKANRQNLELAQNAFEKVPIEERDFTAITISFDPDRIEDARKMIKHFRRNFSRVMESGHRKEVFKLCIQLFPLSRRGTK